jgi:hypothetical protein
MQRDGRVARTGAAILARRLGTFRPFLPFVSGVFHSFCS